MIKVCGISWLGRNKFGTRIKGATGAFNNVRDLYSQMKEKSIIQSVKDFGRFDPVSRNTCLIIALTLFDADICCSKNDLQGTGVLGTNENGCLQSNMKYYKDFVDCGRKLARGNLFIYTLPSTPLAESAIHFGCQGPVVYFTFKEDQTNQILEQGCMMIEEKEVSSLLVINADEGQAICFFLQDQDGALKDSDVSLEKIQDLIKDSKVLSEVIEKISKKGQE